MDEHDLIALIDMQIDVVDTIVNLQNAIKDLDFLDEQQKLCHINAATRLVDATGELMAILLEDIATFAEAQKAPKAPDNVLEFRGNDD